jgi:hypothetical protein
MAAIDAGVNYPPNSARDDAAAWLHSRPNQWVHEMRIFVVLLLLTVCASAEAYIGPGAGLSFLGSLWAVLVGIVVALFAILSWPLRLLWRRLRGKRATKVVAKEDVQESDPV